MGFIRRRIRRRWWGLFNKRKYHRKILKAFNEEHIEEYLEHFNNIVSTCDGPVESTAEQLIEEVEVEDNYDSSNQKDKENNNGNALDALVEDVESFIS